MGGLISMGRINCHCSPPPCIKNILDAGTTMLATLSKTSVKVRHLIWMRGESLAGTLGNNPRAGRGGKKFSFNWIQTVFALPSFACLAFQGEPPLGFIVRGKPKWDHDAGFYCSRRHFWPIFLE